MESAMAPGEHHVRDQDAREQEKPEAGRDAQPRVEAGSPAEGPDPEGRREPRQRNTREDDGNARSPIRRRRRS